MTPLLRARDTLRHYRGERHAIPSASLARLLGLPSDGRQVRQLVGQLIEAGYPIGSTTAHGGGYYLIETEAELRAAVAQVQSRIAELQRRVARLAEAFAEGPRQGTLA